MKKQGRRFCALPSPRELKNTDDADVTMNDFSSVSSSEIDARSTAYLFQRVNKSNRRKYRVILSLVSTMTLIATAIAVISVTVKKMTTKNSSNNSSSQSSSDGLWFDQNTLAPAGEDNDNDKEPLFPLPPIFNQIDVTSTARPPAVAPDNDNDNAEEEEGEDNGPLFSFPTTLMVHNQEPVMPPSADDTPTVAETVSAAPSNNETSWSSYYVEQPTALPTTDESTSPTLPAPPTLEPTVKPDFFFDILRPDDDDDDIDNNDDLMTTTITDEPTAVPTEEPTAEPTQEPTAEPTKGPTLEPTKKPTMEPTAKPIQEETDDDDDDDDDAWVYQEFFPSKAPTLEPTPKAPYASQLMPTPPPKDTTTPWPTNNSPQPTAAPTPRPTTQTTNPPTKAPVASTLAPVISPPKTPSPTFSVHLLGSNNDNDDDDNNNNDITYRPGDLIREEAGLKLSAGLSARILAQPDQFVQYANGEWSRKQFHGRPDAGATFPDTRAFNPGGWIYVSNSEMRDQDPPGGFFNGGVGALTFDRNGNLLHYDMILDQSTHNCGGGRTPWNTWVSCEETGPPHGKVWQVDPLGEHSPEIMTMGSEGGAWESFAYDISDLNKPRFFVTEDHRRGAVQRFTPDNPNWQLPWGMLHGNGTTEYLVLNPDSTGNKGTYEWVRDRIKGRQSALDVYPNCEGIDSDGESLFFVSKRLQAMFTLDLRGNTYEKTSTVRGLFDGKPDQIVRILSNSNGEHHEDDILYFTEEGGKDAGIHGRSADGRYFTILEGIDYKKETTGLAFSPNNMFLYIAFQENGMLFEVHRMDGRPFHAKSLNVKYHAVNQNA